VNEKPTHLDLFSGIGGFALAAGWAGFETIGFCDNEPYAQAVLKKHWPDVPIHGDIKALDGTAHRGVTLLTGGFPCQPFSCAGEQRGKDDDRYLWPQMLRVIQEARPAWVVGENVAGIIGLALDQVCSDLEECGYEVEPIIIPACGVDAPHRRNRVWIIARILGNPEHNGSSSEQTSEGLQYEPEEQKEQNEVGQSSRASSTPQDVADSFSMRELQSQGCKQEQREWLGNGRTVLADTSSTRCKAHLQQNETNRPTNVKQSYLQNRFDNDWWKAEPSICRVADGIQHRTHRLKGLGNAIVPQVAYQIIKGIRELL
jgi:DNA (cytosine-5)-methyltransferase 1